MQKKKHQTKTSTNKSSPIATIPKFRSNSLQSVRISVPHDCRHLLKFPKFTVYTSTNINNKNINNNTNTTNATNKATLPRISNNNENGNSKSRNNHSNRNSNENDESIFVCISNNNDNDSHLNQQHLYPSDLVARSPTPIQPDHDLIDGSDNDNGDDKSDQDEDIDVNDSQLFGLNGLNGFQKLLGNKNIIKNGKIINFIINNPTINNIKNSKKIIENNSHNNHSKTNINKEISKDIINNRTINKCYNRYHRQSNNIQDKSQATIGSSISKTQNC